MSMHLRNRLMGGAMPLEIKDASGGGPADTSALPESVKKALDEIMAATKALRDTVDANDRETKRVGSEIKDVVRKEQLDRTSAAIDKLRDDINAELVKLRRPAIGDGPTDKKAAAQLDAFKTMAAPRVEFKSDDDARAAHLAYKAASARYARYGEKHLTADELKTLQVGVATDGGYLVQPERSSIIVEKVFETSPIRPHATVITVGTNRVILPTDRDEATAGWVGENSTRTETSTPTVGELDIDVHEMYAMPGLTQNMIDDASIDIEAWLDRKVADKFTRTENAAFISGDGQKQPFGILSTAKATTTDEAGRAFGTVQYVITGTSGGFGSTTNGSDKMLDVIHELKQAYLAGARWLLARRTMGGVRKLKDGQGNYVYGFRLGDNALTETIWNYPATIAEDMSAIAADSYSIAFGNWSRAYAIVERQGIRQLRDPFTTKGKVLVYTTRRVGGRPMDTEAYKLLKFGTS